MHLADVEIAPVNSALQQREETLNGVSVGFDTVSQRARPFFFAVGDGIVALKTATDATIGAKLISHQPALRIDITYHNITKGSGGNILSFVGTCL